MKTILVTGAAGFLGSHLCEKLLGFGDRVIGVDNLFTGSLDNLRKIEHNPNFLFINHDICEPLKIKEKIDEIYNLACPASPKHYQKDPVWTLKTNVWGALNMLELAKENKAKIFQASTSEVYGDPERHPQSEDYRGNVNPIGPRACYDEGKRAAETLFFDYNRNYGLEIKVVRIFNTYGPQMAPDDGRVVSNFIIQAISGKPITVYGEGKQTRSFCYVDDLIRGFISMMNTGKDVTGPVNLGNPNEMTVKELATLIINLTGSKSNVVFEKLPVDDPVQRRPDISKAKNLLNWEPKIDLKTGVKKTIEYFESLYL